LNCDAGRVLSKYSTNWSNWLQNCHVHL